MAWLIWAYLDFKCFKIPMDAQIVFKNLKDNKIHKPQFTTDSLSHLCLQNLLKKFIFGTLASRWGTDQFSSRAGHRMTALMAH